ncbi:MAG TPA: hypothetical protein VKE74_12605 [Gemmataceae bacterium]|nr:hypothetical protein [Gemmataceae bacterium]
MALIVLRRGGAAPRPAGTTHGTIAFPEQPANVTFGGKNLKTLYITARTSVYTCPMEVTGHRYPGK